MATLPEGKKTDPIVESIPAIPPSQPNNTAGEKSWGDKYKHKVHSFIRNIFGNYIVNFAISALGTYGVITSKPFVEKFQPWIEEASQSLNRITKIPTPFTEVMVEMVTITQFLLFGGHIILPFMGWTHNHRNRQEFELGHKLDVLQQKLGKGTEVTQKRLQEYKYIKDLLKANEPQNLSEDDKALLAKNHIDDKLQFQEHHKSAWQLIKARLIGMSFTTTLSFLFAAGSYYGNKKGIPAINVKKTYLEKGGGEFGKIAYKHMGLRDPAKLGELTALELLYTAVSKLGFDQMEKHELRRQEKMEQEKAKASLESDRDALAKPANGYEEDKKFLQQIGIRAEDADDIAKLHSASLSPATEGRKKILESAGKDFRAREALKPETVMALQ